MTRSIDRTRRSLVAPALTRAVIATACVAVLAACDEPAVTEAPASPSVRAAIPSSASAARNGVTPVVKFGQNEHGSPFDPAIGHDHSSQAQDLLIPRTVVIPVGGQVTYEIDPFHRVNVYRAGTAPDDIDVSKLIDFVSGPVFIPNFVIDDPTNRIAQSPPFQFAIDQTWTTPLGTFNVPGRYLVICNFLPHFAQNDMYGWVIVQ
jgi:lipoprotein-anchoring transpeptidase ErfK/SrfK